MRGLFSAAVIALAAPAAADTAVWLDCAPDLPHYCENIHVGCAGRSKIATGPFVLSFNDTGALHRKDTAPVRVSVTHSQHASVLRVPGTRDWIRVVRGDRLDQFDYTQRIYRGGRALMSRGTCRHLPRTQAFD